MFEQATGGSGNGTPVDEYPDAQAWDRLELLKREKAALGCYVSGHPLARYGNKLSRLNVVASSKVASEQAWSAVSVAGMVEDYQERLFKGGAGGKAAFFEIEDMFGRVRCKVRGDRIETYAHVLTSGEPVLLSGKVSFPVTDEPDDEAEPTLLVDVVEPLGDAVLKSTRSVSIRLSAERTAREHLVALRDLLATSPGSCPVEIVLSLPGGAEAVLDLEGTRVTPTDGILSGLERVFGQTVAELR
jgi:DNA polymerase-3 subunit alpha